MPRPTPPLSFVDAVEGSVSLRMAGEVFLDRLGGETSVDSRVVAGPPTRLESEWRRLAAHRIGGAAPIVLSYLANYLGRAVFLAPEVRSPRLRALFVGWELEQLTTSLHAELNCADVIVAFSDYVAGVYRRHFPGTPVVAAPICPPLPDGIPVDRARWRLPEDATVFVTVFDPVSGFDRKNPHDAYRAFAAAFPGREDVRLVVKAHGRVDRSDPTATDGERARAASFRAACAADPRVLLVDDYLTYTDVLSLIASCDAYVSLARAEGIGLPVLEAMSLGVPSICSAYAAHLDFTTADSALHVPVTLVDIPSDASGHYDPARYAVPPRWAQPDLEAAAAAMRTLADDPAARARWGARASAQARAYALACAQRPWPGELLTALASREVAANHPARETALRRFAAGEVAPWADHEYHVRRARRSLAWRTRLGRFKRMLIGRSRGRKATGPTSPDPAQPTEGTGS